MDKTDKMEKKIGQIRQKGQIRQIRQKGQN